MKVPCFNCELRTQNCHSRCDDYKEYRKEVDKVREKRRNHSEEAYLYRAYVNDSYENVRRGKK